MINKDVFITIRSSQNVDGTEQEGMELVTLGDYQYAKDGARFSYMESELTGLNGTRTVVVIKPDEVVLQRRGAAYYQMVFHPGVSSNFLFQTEFGMVEMGLDTRRLKCDLGEHGGSMEIEYDLDIQKNFLSRNRFRIDVKERGLNA